jgi:hypothetical protein
MPKKIIGVLLLVLLVAMGAFYYQKSTAPVSEQQAAIQEMIAECKYDADFCRYMAAQAAAMEQGMVITSSSQIEGVVATSEMRMDKDGNLSSDTYMGGKLQSSMVVFEDATYMKDAQDGSWYMISSADPEQPTPAEFDVESNFEYDDEGMTITKIGQEACGELTCDKYEIVQVLPADEAAAEMENKHYLFIDTKEHLARKIEMIFAEGSSVMEYRYEAVTISKPSPIKEMPNFTMPAADEGAAFDTDGEMPSEEEIEQMMLQYGLDGG